MGDREEHGGGEQPGIREGPPSPADYAKLQQQMDQYLQQKENTEKLIAMLEFNNEHNKNKVKNMELSNKLLNDKIIDLQQQLEAKDKSEIEEQLLAKMKELDERLTEEKEEILTEMRKKSSEFDDRLLKERQELDGRYQTEVKMLKDQVKGLEEIKDTNAHLIKQIETNNCEMHIKLGDVQVARDGALSQVKDLGEKNEELLRIRKETEERANSKKIELEQKIKETEETRCELDRKLKEEERRRKELEERIAELEKSGEELRQQVAKSNDTKEQFAKELNAMKQFKETLSADLSSLKEAKEKMSAELQKVSSQNEEYSKNLTKETSECERLRGELDSLRQSSSAVEDSLRQQLKDLTTEVEGLKAANMADRDEKIRLLQTQLEEKEQQVLKKLDEAKQSSEQELQRQLKSLSAEYDRRLSSGTTSSSSEGPKTEMAEATASQKEEGRNGFLEEAEALVTQVEKCWREKAKGMLAKREQELKEEMERLQQEWVRERKELERLTGVAAAAFRTGTDSVELLKAQVQQQRQELQLIKHQHQLEVTELKTLLEVKQRKKRLPEGGVRLATTLEDAAEFEYLRNVLYQFMLGKETQTLAKVLCAVVKFDKEQQQEITAFQQQSTPLPSLEIEKQEALQ